MVEVPRAPTSYRDQRVFSSAEVGFFPQFKFPRTPGVSECKCPEDTALDASLFFFFFFLFFTLFLFLR